MGNVQHEVSSTILDAILAEQREQTRLLKSINGIVQFWGVLLVLSLIGTCLFVLFGGLPLY